MPKTSFSEPYRATIGLLVEARKAAGVTQTTLAEQLGKPQSFVAKFEGLERRLDIVEFFAIADAIGLHRSALFRGLDAAMGPNLKI